MRKFDRVLMLTLLSISMIFSTFLVHAQAKNAIGIGPAINGSKEGTGMGAVLQGEIRLAKSFALVPSIGVEIPYVGYTGLSGKYYLPNKTHVSLGGFLHVGGDDAGDSGFGGSAGFGIELLSTQKHIIDLDIHGDVFQIDGDPAFVGGLRLTYNFSFSRQRMMSP
ncbi:MAG: hypothetical protein ABIQ31_27335 [Ferruginibacter sp.]